MGKISEAVQSLFGFKKSTSKKQNMVRTEFYRGHLLKRNPAHPDYWSVTIKGNSMVGKLEYVKKSVEQWCDHKVLVAPDYFEKNMQQLSEQLTFDYKEFKLKNDHGGDNGWYLTYRGRLMKGSKVKIIEAIDLLEKKREECGSKADVT
ncbi:DUF3319 domain-containing protein [Vibrio sp. ZSDE26]|uniref:DUF3319 domain-containing protein n=1 Tax=Vibrio amylolyticus TaxID=2847292 RepID=A0A9X2BGW7_9VIBR|nr:DUF3319 domain-containing protein [Vibrio amylolyticus]MCK6263389.1 DUF3319 domain-containing protein [Vibrio amylolyticus]